MTEFSARDPSDAAFWNQRFAADHTPWDARGVPPALTRFLEERAISLGRRVLVPGCGSAYEAAAFDAAGFDVLAIDYAEVAVARARLVLPPNVAARVLRQANLFELDAEPFDWIYERAFLAALPTPLWARWATRVTQLVVPGGYLAGFFFVDESPPAPRRGPPFAATAAELDTLLAEFTCVADTAVPPEESVPVFAGRERWMVRRRR